MGTQILLECNNCLDVINDHTFFSFEIGAGLLYSTEYLFKDTRNLKKELLIFELVKDKKNRSALMEILKKEFLANSYGYKLFACKKCNCLSNRFDFEIEYKDSKNSSTVYKPTFYCSKCRHTLSPLKILDNKLVFEDTMTEYPFKCAKCNCDKYKISEILAWD